MWTERQIATLWSVAVLLLAAAWGVAYFTGDDPERGEEGSGPREEDR